MLYCIRLIACILLICHSLKTALAAFRHSLHLGFDICFLRPDASDFGLVLFFFHWIYLPIWIHIHPAGLPQLGSRRRIFVDYVSLTLTTVVSYGSLIAVCIVKAILGFFFCFCFWLNYHYLSYLSHCLLESIFTAGLHIFV